MNRPNSQTRSNLRQEQRVPQSLESSPWGAQDLIRSYDGVLSTRVGYTVGTISHATYRNHDGHAEAVEIMFDPARVSYRQILEFFFQIHDAST